MQQFQALIPELTMHYGELIVVAANIEIPISVIQRFLFINIWNCK